ncbi:MAG: GNAT family N-acetyltransferase [Xenococcaceae cyanobacterium]
MNQNIVRLERSQFKQAIEILGDAFDRDPIFGYFASQKAQSRLNAIEWFSKIFLQYSHVYNHVYTTTDLKGIAVWIPPKQYPLNDLRLLGLGGYALPFKMRLSRLREFISLFLRLEEQHKQDLPQPHWYLMMLGVKADCQSQGIGSKLLQPILQTADKEGLPCYLETSTDRAVRFYQKNGFEITNTFKLSQNNLQLWTMKRNSK